MSMVNLNVRRLTYEATLPTKSYDSDAGFDLYASEAATLAPGGVFIVSTGIVIAPRFFQPYKHLALNIEAQIRPRSGMVAKHHVTVLNSPGTVDESYRGEIKVILKNFGKEPYYVMIGDRIAQLVLNLVPVARVTERDENEWKIFLETERGEGGFGSTGK
jgi:dUTP pyrophosphatase